MKLTDTQFVILSAASQRKDRGVEVSAKLKGSALQKVLGKLIEARLVEEVRAKGGLPVWRRDEENVAYALRITRTGMRAIAATDDEQADGRLPVASPKALAARSNADRKGATSAYRPKKIDEVVALLRRPSGAGLDELVATTGWLPHTTRAALSGLRKSGHLITRERDARGASRYRISQATSAES
jgi:hypothetical protein